MKILAHRGAWNAPEEKNTLKSFSCALQNNWGIESDVRDYIRYMETSYGITPAKWANLVSLYE